MTEKPAAEVLADECDRSAEGWLSEVKTRRRAAAMLRTIPAMEVELMEQARIVGMGAERELSLIAERSTLTRERDALRAEVEALRADAERYRWLRAKENQDNNAWNSFGPYNSPQEIDAAIDAARKS